MNNIQSKDTRSNSLKNVTTNGNCSSNEAEPIVPNAAKPVATETTFGYLKIDERFKKLERMLKLTLLKNTAAENMDSSSRSPLPTFSNISSINGDFVDLNCASPRLNSSRTGSEVVSSSINLRDILLNKKNPRHDLMVATSSVKQYPTKQGNLNDSIAMPPPSTFEMKFHDSKQKKCLDNVNNMMNIHEPMPEINRVLNTPFFKKYNPHVSKSICSAKTDGSKVQYIDSSNSQTPIENMQNEMVTIFSNWKVVLNNQGQLIIKGTLECGKVVRSKPVIRRLTLTSVESVYKRTYYLRGNIFDERNELPEYVCGKFYNGFPDDWENVHQIWRSFISQGSPKNFRWPTPITDSDDDLRSEITDITFMKHTSRTVQDTKDRSRDNRRNRSFSNISFESQTKKDCQSRYATKNPEVESDVNQSFHDCSNKRRMNESLLETDLIRSKETLSSSLNAKGYNNLSSKEEREQVEKSSHNDSFVTTKTVVDAIREDKLNIIINNLADKNCPREYIDKVIEMFSVLNYVVTYKSGTESEAGNEIERNHLSEYKHRSCEIRKPRNKLKEDTQYCNTLHLNGHQESNVDSDSAVVSNCSESISPRREIIINEHRSKSKSTVTTKKPELLDVSRVVSSNSDDVSNFKIQRNVMSPETTRKACYENLGISESEMYAGILKIPMERFLHLINVEKTSFEHSSNKSLDKISPSKSKKRIIANSKTGNNKDIDCESAVSITEDETDILHGVKYDTLSNRRMETNTNQRMASAFTDTRESVKKHSQRNLRQVLTPSSSSCSEFESESPRQSEIPRTRKKLGVIPINRRRTRNKHFYCESANIQNCRATYQDNCKRKMKSTCPNKENKIHKKVPSEFITDSVNIEEPHSNNLLRNSDNIHSLNKLLPKITQCSKRSPSEFEPLQKKQKVIMTDRTEVEDSVNMNCQSNTVPLSCTSNVNVTKKANENLTGKQEKRVNNKIVVNKKSSVSMNNDNETSDSVACIKNQNKLSPENNSENQPISPNYTSKYENNKFGSKSNPKLLTAWMPDVVYNDSKFKSGLIFRGTLLNEAGYILKKKFSTDFILQKVTSRLIETENHEYYKLVGDLNNINHVVPKQLVSQCQNRCPLNIQKFCNDWNTLTEGNISRIAAEQSGSTIDSLRIRTSSRGRHILPPLNYWTGERFALIDNNPIYSPGTSQESSIISTLGSTENIQTSKNYDKKESPTKMTKESNKKQNLSNGKKKAKESSGSPTNKKNIQIRKIRRLKNKRRSVEQITSSDDNEETNVRRSQRIKMTAQTSNVCNAKNDQGIEHNLRSTTRKSKTNSHAQHTSMNPSQEENETAIKQRHKLNLRKQKEINYIKREKLMSASRNSITSPSRCLSKYQLSGTIDNGIRWSYQRKAPLQDNVLSDEELSQV